MSTEPQQKAMAQADPADSGAPVANHNGGDRRQPAMTEFRNAVEGGKVEKICTSFQSLRRAVAGLKVRELFELADKALGRPAREVVVSAFSHRRCFMCDGGSVPCDSCEGTGHVAAGRDCPSCDGAGIAPCDFCRGTGWGQSDAIPLEIRDAVLELRRIHVNKQLEGLFKMLGELTPESAQRLSGARKRAVAQLLIKVQARVAEVIANLPPADQAQAERLGAAADSVSKAMELLKTRK